MIRDVVVVGASLAGLRAVESLRTNGYDGHITVVGAEPYLPYDRPPLSKRLLAGEWEPERIALRKQSEMEALGATWLLGRTAAELDLSAGEVVLDDGGAVPFDGAIVATGSRARELPGQRELSGVVTLRTIDQAMQLRAQLAGGDKRVVVVGAGFIGLEVAATARELGNDVLVLEVAPVPLARVLGPTMGAAVAAVHADHGVEVRCGVSIEGLVRGAVLTDGGWHESADVVVVGIGVDPEVDWLASSGLEVRDGLVCAPDLNVGVPLIYGAGDIVRWHNSLFDEEMRVEHWTNAAEQGALAASNLLAEATGRPTVEYAPVPFFWSEQYDRRIQFLGRAGAGDDVQLVSGSIESRQFVVLYGRHSRLRGVLGMNAPREVMRYRAMIQTGASWSDALAASG